MEMRAVYIVDKVPVARVLVDPMRRAILGLLREKPMTQTQLAEELGLSNASLNYHMRILQEHKLVDVTKRVAEEHGIIQKFFVSAAYLFVYDLDSIPKDVSRYFYPISLERAWAFLAVFMIERGIRTYSSIRLPGYPDINSLSNTLSRSLVAVAKQHVHKKVSHPDERIAYEIYTKAFSQLLNRRNHVATLVKSRKRAE